MKTLFLLTAAVSMLLGSCGYILQGGSPPLPWKAKSIALLPVRNQTFDANLDLELAVQMTDLLRSNSSVLLLSAEHADIVLELVLTDIQEIRMKSSAQSDAGVTWTLKGHANLNDRRKGKKLWDQIRIQVDQHGKASNLKQEIIQGIQTEYVRKSLIEQFSTKVYDQIFLTF